MRALTRRDIRDPRDLSFICTRILEGERLTMTLEERVGNARIESLPVPFTVVNCANHPASSSQESVTPTRR